MAWGLIKAHFIEQVDEPPLRKRLCLSCAMQAGWL
jgi:hypothetical protein